MIRRIDLLVLTSSDQILKYGKNIFILNKTGYLMRRSTVLSLPLSVRVPWTNRLSISHLLSLARKHLQNRTLIQFQLIFFQLFAIFRRSNVLRNRLCKRNFSLIIHLSLFQGDQKIEENRPNLGKRSQNS